MRTCSDRVFVRCWDFTTPVLAGRPSWADESAPADLHNLRSFRVLAQATSWRRRHRRTEGCVFTRRQPTATLASSSLTMVFARYTDHHAVIGKVRFPSHMEVNAYLHNYSTMTWKALPITGMTRRLRHTGGLRAASAALSPSSARQSFVESTRLAGRCIVRDRKDRRLSTTTCYNMLVLLGTSEAS